MVSDEGFLNHFRHSCIVIHGFGGHAIGSFRDPHGSFTWIRDSLPKDLPELNVLTYGYNSSFNDEESVADVFEWSQAFRLALCGFRTKMAEVSVSSGLLAGISSRLTHRIQLVF